MADGELLLAMEIRKVVKGTARRKGNMAGGKIDAD